MDRLSDQELRAIELEENTQRLGLLDYDATRLRMGATRRQEALERAEAEKQAEHEKARAKRISGDAAAKGRCGRRIAAALARRLG